MLRFARMCAVVSLAVLAAGCAATRVATHGVGSGAPVCESSAQADALILWGTAWRANQKDSARREQMADRAIRRFFAGSSCFASAEVMNAIGGRSAIGVSDAEVLKWARADRRAYSKIVVLRVEELGPLLVVHPSPVLWEGGTEVMLRARVLDAPTAALDRDVAVHWKNSGPFVLKGQWTLEEDMHAALRAMFGRERSGGKK